MRIPTPKQKPNGKWYIQLRLEGRSIYIDGWNRAQVEAKAMAHKAGLVERRRSGRITLAEAVDNYIRQRESVLSPATIRSYRATARSTFPVLMDRDLQSITESMWQSAINRAATQYKPKTIKERWMLCHAVLVENGITVPRVRLPQVMPEEQGWFTPEQVIKFLRAIEGNQWEAHWLLGLHSLRSAEIFGLQWEDVGEQDIYVHRTLLRSQGGYVLTERTKNPASTRHIPYLIPRLKTVFDGARWHTGSVCRGTPNGCAKALATVCERNDLPKIGLHGLRRSFASLAYHLRLSERETMVIGGWTSYNTMHRFYIRLSNRDIRDATDRFQRFFATGITTDDVNALERQ